MRTYISSFFILFSLFFPPLKSQNAANSYTAAVVEYHPLTGGVDINLKEYLNILSSINQTTDLIVFPESTLNGHLTAVEVPNGSEKKVLCNSDTINFLNNISCAAIKYNTHIVINIDEKELNSTNDYVYYNCDVVFDNNGAVVAKYRKWNLFGEHEKKRPPTVELPIINIKNISFGIFTCFDILFQVPSLNVTHNLGVKNVIFPTMWFGELPFLTSIQTQDMYAEANNVAVIAANANNPTVGSGGSGLYVGQYGAIAQKRVATGGNAVLIKEIPNLEVQNNPLLQNISYTNDDIDLIGKEMDNFYLKQDNSLGEYNTVPLDLTQESTNVTVCHGTVSTQICCNFFIKISQNDNISDINDIYYKYRLASVSHSRSFNGVRNGGMENCAIISCLDESILSCGKRFSNYSEVSWPVTFENVTVSAYYVDNDSHFQYPNSLLSSITPIPANERRFTKNTNGNLVYVEHKLEKAQNRLMTFGILGRDFSRDTEREQDMESSGDNGNNSANLVEIRDAVVAVGLALVRSLVLMM